MSVDAALRARAESWIQDDPDPSTREELTALLAQKPDDPMAAAVCAVWLHGAAADRCAARRSQYAMLPHDLFEDLGALLAEEGR